MTLEKAQQIKKRLDLVTDIEPVDVRIISSATGYVVDVISSGYTLTCSNYLTALDGKASYFAYAEQNHPCLRFTYLN